jgi:hypothetical protein
MSDTKVGLRHEDVQSRGVASRTFVELTDTFVADFDLIDFLSALAERCGELRGAGEMGPRSWTSGAQIMASSTERMRTTELLEMANKEGPCMEFRTGAHMLNRRLDENEAGWPLFALGAQERVPNGPRLPVPLRDELIGAVKMFDIHLSRDHRAEGPACPGLGRRPDYRDSSGTLVSRTH